eukprot:comp22288_c1_seq1/m.33035 comp22288_c1_seq1/g.33035  ORF comp22288_c1_seq1/g.33035 comp22288_c1_seq1/m.33035 type:complete len:499 (-) comp22288_c1_seq1:407-1903(-)
MTWVTVVLLGGAAVCGLIYVTRREPVDPKIPKVKGGLPILGHTTLLARLVREGRLFLQTEKWVAEYGNTYCLPILGINSITFTDAAMIRQVLNDSNSFVTSFSMREVVSSLGDTILLTMDGAHWKRHRKLLQPSFGAPQLRLVHELTNRETDRLFSDWHQSADHQVEALEGLKTLTMNIIGQLGFSMRFEEGGSHHNAVARVFVGMGRRIAYPWRWSWRFLMDDQDTYEQAVKDLRGVVAEILDSRISALASDPPSLQNKESIKDVIDVMLATRLEGEAALSRDEMLDEILTLYLAGHETTSNGLFWCMFCLATNPTEQDRLREEVLKVSGSQSPTYEDIPKMTYLDGFIRECLRLHPPAPIVSRLAVKDVQVGPYTVHAGNDVLINIYGAQTDLRYWKDPKKLDPERWQNPEEGKGAYLPFGHGHKMCLGWRVAMTEMLCFVARLVQSYTVSLSEEQARLVVPFQTFTVTCFNPVHFTLVPVVKGQGVAPTTMSSGV